MYRSPFLAKLLLTPCGCELAHVSSCCFTAFNRHLSRSRLGVASQFESSSRLRASLAEVSAHTGNLILELARASTATHLLFWLTFSSLVSAAGRQARRTVHTAKQGIRRGRWRSRPYNTSLALVRTRLPVAHNATEVVFQIAAHLHCPGSLRPWNFHCNKRC